MNHNFEIDPNIHVASTLPTQFYTEDSEFERLKKMVFLQSWQFIGNKAQVALPESAFPTTLFEGFLNEPLVMIKNDKGNINTYSNVCTHRGNVVVQNAGKIKDLRCFYHGRRFSLEGKMEHMPEFEQAQNFPRPCDDLHRFETLEWGPLVFSKMGNGIEFKKILDFMDNRIGFLPLEQFNFSAAMSKEYLVNAHWALYCDNYLEGFHIPFVHKDLNNVLDYGDYSTTLFDHCVLQTGYGNRDVELFDLPEGHVDYGNNVAAYYFWVYPNMMFNFYPWGLSLNIVKPISKTKTKVSFLSYIFDESKIEASAGAQLDKVEREDEFVVEAVQKGISSNYYKAGRYSPTRETGVHHFHRMLSHSLNK